MNTEQLINRLHGSGFSFIMEISWHSQDKEPKICISVTGMDKSLSHFIAACKTSGINESGVKIIPLMDRSAYHYRAQEKNLTIESPMIYNRSAEEIAAE